MSDTILEVSLITKLERSICAYYGTEAWVHIVQGEIGVKSCRYHAGVTTIEFESEEYYTAFILRWT